MMLPKRGDRGEALLAINDYLDGIIFDVSSLGEQTSFVRAQRDRTST